MKSLFLPIFLSISVPSWALEKTHYSVPFTETPIEIDGFALESQWQTAPWKAIDQKLLGPDYAADDFTGQFKLLWDAEYLYLLAEIQDDILIDKIADPLERYWDDECLEIFIDEDASGGIHTYNYNAFAYHVALDNQVVDIDLNEKPALYNDHIQSNWKYQKDGKILWELAIRIFTDEFTLDKPGAPVRLSKGKSMGFMVAYCDNDGSDIRENFIGSEPIAGEDKNLGYIDAGVFGRITLKK